MTATTRSIVRAPVAFVTSRSYRAARAVGLTRRSLQHRRSPEPPVIVHQMGKVGSTAVHAAIETACPNRVVYQIHHLTASALADEEATYRDAFEYRGRIDGHLLDGLYVRRLLDSGRLPSTTAVVSLVRDPMAQRLSSFFQTLPFRMPDFQRQVRERPVDELAVDIVDQFHQPGWWHDDRIARFFRDQFHPVWGIDVFTDAAFDHDESSLRATSSEASALVLRFEDLRAGAPSPLARFLGVPELTLPDRQVSADKAYAPVLDCVRRTLQPDDEYLERAYASAEVRHFYTDAEIDGFRARWVSAT